MKNIADLNLAEVSPNPSDPESHNWVNREADIFDDHIFRSNKEFASNMFKVIGASMRLEYDGRSGDILHRPNDKVV